MDLVQRVEIGMETQSPAMCLVPRIDIQKLFKQPGSIRLHAHESLGSCGPEEIRN